MNLSLCPCRNAFLHGFFGLLKNPIYERNERKQATAMPIIWLFPRDPGSFLTGEPGFSVFTPRNPTLVFRGVSVFYRQDIFPLWFLSFTGPFPGKRKGKNKNDGNMQELRKQTAGSDGSRRSSSRSAGRCPCDRHKNYRRVPLRRHIRHGLLCRQ